MNQKILLGFLAGAVGATAITYFAANYKSSPDQQAAAPPAAAVTVSTPVETTPPVEVEPRHRKVAPRKIVETEAVAAIAPDTPSAPTPAQAASEPQPAPVVAPPAPEPPPAPAPPPPPPAPVAAPEPPHSVTIASGTLLPVRLGEGLSTKRNQSGDTFSATLNAPLVVGGFAIAERGARVEGRIIQSEQAGRVKGLAHLALELTKINTSDGQRVEIHTEQYDKMGPESKGEDAAKIGAGAVLGTIIGALAGGGKGAAIGAGAGGAAGTGTVMSTRGKPAEIPVETLVTFKIDRPITITERK